MRTIHSELLIRFVSLAALAAACASASAAVIHVNAAAPVLGDGASWTTAMPHLTDALAAAQVGDEIWVVGGTYYPDTSGANPTGSGNRAASFEMKSGVRVLGGFAGNEGAASDRNPAVNLTVLSGDIGARGPSADNSYNIVAAVGVVAATVNGTDYLPVLDGFTLRLAVADGVTTEDTYLGGGIYMHGGTTLAVSNCRFENNWSRGGGGISVLGGSAPVISACVFTGNYGWSAGAVRSYGSSPTISDCLFQSNTGGYGGAIGTNEYAGGLVERCVFLTNHGVNGGAVQCAGFSTTVFRDCMFRKNRAEYLNAFQQRWNGGAVNNWCSGTTWINCVMAGNTCNGNGGAFYDGGPSGTRPTIVNCTMYGNYSRDGGAVAADPNHTPLIRNTIVWDNTVSAGDPSLFGGVVVERCDVQGMVVGTGNGNLNVDPQFVSPLGNDGMNATGDEDFGLLGTSLLIDAGDNTYLPPGVPTDYAGNARIVDGEQNGTADVDLGAFEFLPPPPPPCIGDANGDRQVTFADVTSILTNWGGPGPLGDSDTSGVVNFADITATLTNWGANCNPS